MPNLQFYSAIDNDWATHIEMVVGAPEPGREEGVELLCRSENPIRFVLATVSTPEGTVGPHLDAGIALLDRNGRPLADNAGENFSSSQLVIFNQPSDRTWLVTSRGAMPYEVCAMAFHPSAAMMAGVSVPATPLKCRICKSTAKALALAIVAAASYPAIPAALISAVAAFLGAATLAAAAFINSVLGDVASVIAQKLCHAVGLCP